MKSVWCNNGLLAKYNPGMDGWVGATQQRGHAYHPCSAQIYNDLHDQRQHVEFKKMLKATRYSQQFRMMSLGLGGG